jgi:hypothetical protein
MTDEPTVWYRYVDSDQEWSRDPYELTLRVIRYTPKCVVLDLWGREYRVLLNARKRFAYPTRELAMESYIARKQMQIGWTQAAHDRAVENLASAEAMRDRGFVRAPNTFYDFMERNVPGFSREPDSSPCPPAVI